MYFMSQNWPITHCLESWCGLKLTEEKIVNEHPGMLSTMLVSCSLKRFWRRFLMVWGAGERMRTVKCWHFVGGRG